MTLKIKVSYNQQAL